jgi:hypothetical protein
MAYGNKFVKTKSEKKPLRIKVKSPHGAEYLMDPWMESAEMTPWELTAAIKFFLDLQDAPQPKHAKPNRFVHFQRH